MGIGLQVADQDLPRREQEALETVVGLLAVGIVTFMIVWMRRHARGMAGELRESARGAGEGLGGRGRRHGLAVVREGLETAAPWTSSLLTGMLGLQPFPTAIEVIGSLVYAVPMAIFVLWPAGRRRVRAPGERTAPPRRSSCSFELLDGADRNGGRRGVRLTPVGAWRRGGRQVPRDPAGARLRVTRRAPGSP